MAAATLPVIRTYRALPATSAFGIEFCAMKSRVSMVYLTLLVLSCGVLGAAPKEKIVVVKRPIVVAFFTPVKDADLAKDPDTNEALADFQVYAGKVRDQLAGMGIDFEEVYATSFIVKCLSFSNQFVGENGQTGNGSTQPLVAAP